MYEVCAETLGFRLIWRDDSPSRPVTTESHYFRIGCSGESWSIPHAFNGTLKQKLNYACRALLTRKILRVSKTWFV